MQKIRIDFDNPGLPQHISAVENDSQSRFFQATLYENGKAYTAPAGATYSIMYRGFGPQNQGWYDTINDGAGKRAACAVSGNVVTCEIARQALQVPGHVSIVLCVTTGKGYMLKSWPIECDCKNDRYDSTAEIQSFFYITQVSNADWNRAIQALEELKNIIDPTLSLSGKAADAKATGDAVGQVKEDLDDFANNVFDDTSIKIRGLGNIPNSYKKIASSVGVADTYISLQYNKNYLSYVFWSFRNGSLYFEDDVLGLGYCAIAKGTNPTGDWYDVSSTIQRLNVSSSVRYRISEGNLPTSNNKMNISIGDIVVITVPNDAGTLNIYGSVFNNALKENIALSATQYNQVNDIVQTSRFYKIIKLSDTQYDVEFGAYKTHLIKSTTENFEHWNLLGIECSNIELVTTETDILGPIRETNNLYIGGVHGKEKTTDLTIIADGIIQTMSVGDIINCKKLDIIHESDITSTVTNEVTWNRFYHLIFTNMKLVVENNYRCIKETTIKRATNGGIFGSPNTVTNAIAVTNKLYKPAPTSDKTVTSYIDNTIEATWYYSNGHSITMSNLVGKEENGYKCIMTVYGAETPIRTKIYFLPVDTSTNYNDGDVLYGKFQLEFN